ncbi:hypothetical protein IT398_02525 [Candidatus Nomurabacteria bacterium]|nr:hypothetical protein [Candidatus Nomurabacteria bacterium]
MSVRAIVYVGSSSVSGGLISEKKLVFQTEKECRVPEKLEGKIFLDDVGETLKRVMADLLGAKMGSPEKVLIFLASPFIVGSLNIIRHTAEKPFSVTEKLVGELLMKETEKIKNDPKQSLIDSKIMRFRLNGYTVNEPHGQVVSNLEIAHYLSVASREVTEKFGGIIRSACHHDQVEWHSSSFAIFTSLRDKRPTEQSFVLVDIGGELTELTLVWRGIIRETMSYPIGSHALVREAMVSGEQASVVARAKLESEGEDKKGRDYKSETEWAESFVAGLEKVLQHRFWSGEIVLLVEEGSLGSRFAKILRQADLGKTIFSAKLPVINLLEPKTLSLLTDFCVKIK